MYQARTAYILESLYGPDWAYRLEEGRRAGLLGKAALATGLGLAAFGGGKALKARPNPALQQQGAVQSQREAPELEAARKKREDARRAADMKDAEQKDAAWEARRAASGGRLVR